MIKPACEQLAHSKGFSGYMINWFLFIDGAGRNASTQLHAGGRLLRDTYGTVVI
jgi:hypothetical protein